MGNLLRTIQEVQTVGAITIAGASWNLQNGFSANFNFKVTGKNTLGIACSFEKMVTIQNTLGICTIVGGTLLYQHKGVGLSGTNINEGISGTIISCNITGVAGHTINWYTVIDVRII